MVMNRGYIVLNYLTDNEKGIQQFITFSEGCDERKGDSTARILQETFFIEGRQYCLNRENTHVA